MNATAPIVPSARAVAVAAVARVAARRQAELAGFRFDPAGYIERYLGWTPWRGTPEQPGQADVIDAYTHALRAQDERTRYEAGELSADQLHHYRPGEPIRNRIRVASGHTIGKTKLASGLVGHFFDCFPPAIVYTFAPTYVQVHDLLWKEIKADRRGSGLPGQILDLAIRRADDHFALGRATNNAGGTGTERIQGQHGPYLMFVIDEAEGVADYVWNAIESMTSGGTVIVLMLANPRTRSSPFHRAAARADTASFRISCLWHPNVVAGRELIPGAVRREYVDAMIETHCQLVAEPDADRMTFSVPWRDGIWAPDSEFMFRVLGVAPVMTADATLIPTGRYAAALEREPMRGYLDQARIGVDVARFGRDAGTVYVRHDGAIWRAAQLYQADTTEYAIAIRDAALDLYERGATSIHVRIDAGGGYGGGVSDQLARDQSLIGTIPDFRVYEVHFNAAPTRLDQYLDFVTEMYAEAAETLNGVGVVNAPPELEDDLTDRRYEWRNRAGVAVRVLEPKDEFRKRRKRSPDDGDGFVLAAAPDYLFETTQDTLWTLPDDDQVTIGPRY